MALPGIRGLAGLRMFPRGLAAPGGGGPPTSVYALAANRAQIPTTTAGLTMNSTQAYVSRRSHYAHPGGDVSNLVFIDVNWAMGQTTQAGIGASRTISKWVEYGGNTYQVTWGGATSVTIANAGQVESDPLAVTIPAGALFYERTATLGPVTGLSLPCIQTPAAPSAIGVQDGNVLDTIANAATVTVPQGTSHERTVGSSAILGDVAGSDIRSALMVGDSITLGEADVTGVGSKGGSGWLSRKLDAQMSYVKIAIGGQRASQFLSLIGAVGSPIKAFTDALSYSEVFIHYGTNDLRASSTTQFEVLQRLQDLSAYFPGKTVHTATIPPRASGTHTTEAGQTEQTDGSWANLDATNALLRALPSWITGQLLEVADTAMTARDSGIWKAPTPGTYAGYPNVTAAMTSDGTHPVSYGAAYLASNVPFT